MTPDEITDKSNSKTRVSNSLISKNGSPCEGWDYFGYDTHSRQYHDINGRMRVDPEKMLIKYRVTTNGGVKQTDTKNPFGHDHQQSNTDDGCGKHLYPRGSIQRPGEQWHFEPSHTGCPEPVNGHDKVESCQDRRKAKYECCQNSQGHICTGSYTVRSVKGPSGIRRAFSNNQSHQSKDGSHNINPPRQQIEFWKGYIICPEHQGKEKIPENGGNAGYDEKKNHDNPMQGENLVVCSRIYNIPAWSDQFKPHKEPQRNSYQKKGDNGVEIKQCDPLVVH